MKTDLNNIKTAEEALSRASYINDIYSSCRINKPDATGQADDSLREALAALHNAVLIAVEDSFTIESCKSLDSAMDTAAAILKGGGA